MPGFDPDQPRDEKGQWTAGSASKAIQDAASDMNIVDKLLEVNKILAGKPTEKVVEAMEDKIRLQDHETGIIFNKDGELVSIRDGDEGHVDFTEADMGKARDGILTHNHPHDVSFSNGDIYATLDSHIKEVRAVTATHDYIFRPNYKYALPSGVGDARYALRVAYDVVADNTTNELKDSISTGKKTLEQASAEIQHDIMKRFSERTKSEYISRPIKKPRNDKSTYPVYEFLNPSANGGLF